MIAIGVDHIGFDYKAEIMSYLAELGYETMDVGAYDRERCDYPVYGKAVAKAIQSGKCDCGILICGTGVGISLAANKVHGIRAVVCSEPYTAVLSKQHNNTNVLCFGARVIGIELAKMIVKVWLEAEFEGQRHGKRVEMIDKIEKEEASYVNKI